MNGIAFSHRTARGVTRLSSPAGVSGILPGRELPGATVPNGRISSLMEETANSLSAAGIEPTFARSDPEFPARRVGVLERRVLDRSLGTTDLAVAAARCALARSGVDRERVRTVVVATVTPTGPVPAVATGVAEALGLAPGCTAFDLTLGCNGFLVALAAARAQLLGGGAGDAALVIGADAMSRVMDTADRTTFPIFGDGAGALVLTAEAVAGAPGPAIWTHGDGGPRIRIRPDSSARPLYRMAAEGDRCVLVEERAQRLVVELDGRRVFRDMVRLLPERVRASLDELGLGLGDVDRFAFHQANARLVDAVVEALGLDSERVLMNIASVGNTTNASIPLLLDDASRSGRLRAGDRVLLVGFGSGYSLGTALLQWS